MSDIQRDIGGLEARMDEHDKRFDRIERSIAEGFKGTSDGFREINSRLDDLTSAENRRIGAMGLIKVVIGSAGVYGLWEMTKGLFHK